MNKISLLQVLIKPFSSFTSTLVLIAQISSFSAFEMIVVGINNDISYFKALVHTAPTFANHLSGAKIETVSARYQEGKTNEHVKKLIFWDPHTKLLPFDIFKFFPNIEVLEVGRAFQDMAAPLRNHFANATHLDKLLITNQVFYTLGPNVFDGAIRITSVNFEHNQISSVHRKAFIDAKSLKILSLRANTIVSLPGEVFAELRELELIDLRNNLFTTLPSGLFATNGRLKTVMLDSNRILFLKNFKLKAPVEKFTLLDNLCVDDNFMRFSGGNKLISRDCSMDLSPTELFETYKELQFNPQNCSRQINGGILGRTNHKSEIDLEIEEIEAAKQTLTENLSAIESLQICQVD